MKRQELIYIIYVFSVFLMTVYLSDKIIRGGFQDLDIVIRRFFRNSTFSKKLDFSKIPLTFCISNMKANIIMTDTIEDYRKNSIGFRDYEWSLEKPNNTFRIVALGDSFTEGLGVNFSDSWPKQLERKLNDLELNVSFEVLNFGSGGIDINEKLEIYNKTAQLYNPDMVILQFWPINDLKNNSKVKEIYEDLYRKYEIGEIEVNIMKNYKDLMKKGFTKERILAEHLGSWAYDLWWENEKKKPFEERWSRAEKSLEDLINLTVKKNSILLIVTWECRDYQKDMVNNLESFCKEHTVPFVDLDQEIFSLPESKIRLPDGHLTKLGYDIVSDEILKEIKDNI